VRSAGAEREGSLETTTVRISNDLAICEAPLDIAAELLRAEGFYRCRLCGYRADDLFCCDC